MKTAILVLYIVTNGQMSTVRIPQDSTDRCEANRAPFTQQLGAVHAECKLTKGKKQWDSETQHTQVRTESPTCPTVPGFWRFAGPGAGTG